MAKTEQSELFLECMNYALNHEGVYSNNLNDYGGETYKGISRKYNKNWSGWNLLDQMEDKTSENPELDEQVMAFYKKRFWNKGLDLFDGIYSPIHDVIKVRFLKTLFSHSILLGKKKAFMLLQVSINIMLDQESVEMHRKKLVVDGILGPKTFNAIISITTTQISKLGCFYGTMVLGVLANSAISSSKNKIFLNGWINRVVSDLNYMVDMNRGIS